MIPMEIFFSELNQEVIACRKCPRLTAWREKVAREKRKAYQDWEYWGLPVPGFGDPAARVWVVGLAPGAHGSNRTGRHFTGDASGDFLFPALHRAGFANQLVAVHRHDGLVLNDLYISAVCRCAPPDNKPLAEELANCHPFLSQELRLLTHLQGIVALGKIAFDRVRRLIQEPMNGLPKLTFGHNLLYHIQPGLPWLLASYHPSRQNTQTGRLTVEMFDAVWKQVRILLDTDSS